MCIRDRYQRRVHGKKRKLILFLSIIKKDKMLKSTRTLLNNLAFGGIKNSYLFSTQSKFEFLLFEQKDKVGLIKLNRPKALNALCVKLMKELNVLLTECQNNNKINAIVITGSEKAFAAGADIKEMAELKYPNTFTSNFISDWEYIQQIRKPVIAAVNGFALGGGCELAMKCDIVYAGSKAVFGLPEIKLGIIPGSGGSQRLVRAIGKSKAMEAILTGDFFTAQEAEKANLVSKIFKPEEVVDQAVKLGNKIARNSVPIVAFAKEAINQSYNMTLESGLLFERRLFHSTFATQDQKIGMKAFIEKTKPKFKNE
eukprot:TRINITY_DN1448_c0_g1_i2.p1 TRINITY_DN1448_c0_g1~~TRINITY_DN1448_c0_g1_i2.p1  ORF type:complete len:323 (+),score=83.91 TRINITY_DN1448_c0_g1_i2:33-971(+)